MAIRKLALSGRLRSGKDYIATAAGYQLIGFADPMYKIAEWYFGTSDKEAPGIRQFLQYLGQTGWGKVDSEQYAYTINRAVLISDIRRHGHELAGSEFHFVDWNRFGKSPTFWVDILMDRVVDIERRNPFTKIAIVNVRFRHELDPLSWGGFQHFHVKCSQETRLERLGQAYNQANDNDTSEQMAMELDTSMPENRVIWNDHRRKPDSKSYLDVQEFIAMAS